MILSSTLPYVAPFCAFIVLLELSRILRLPPVLMQVTFVGAMAVIIGLTSRRVLLDSKNMRVRNWLGTVLVGVAVFAIWIGPDQLFPNYRRFWLFDNPVVGTAGSAGPPAGGTAALWLRSLRAAAIVPIVEELFWRGWMMRWLIAADFEAVPLGAWSASSFWIVAVLFASEHGRFWDVGLAAGIIYNWWMLRTRSLGDLILTHAVTNACLSAYVVFAGRWEYW